MGKMEAAEQTGLAQPSPSLQAQTATLRQLSRELQNGWIERLFSRLAALYGASFGRQWEGTNLGEVKAVWAEKLGGFTAAQIGAAIKSCDDQQYPPNLPEFIDLCRQAAKREVSPLLTIDAPQRPKEEIEAIREKVIQTIADKSPEYDYRAWCKELKRRYLKGDNLLYIQIKLASEAMGEVWENRKCRPVENP